MVDTRARAGVPHRGGVGFDVDPPSIADARQAAAASADRPRPSFDVRDATEVAAAGQFDLVCFFEALHDLPRPVQALAGARRALTSGACVLVMDERVADLTGDAAPPGRARPPQGRPVSRWSGSRTA